MAGAPSHMQDEIIDAEEFLDRIDNHKVLLEYGINLCNYDSDLINNKQILSKKEIS